MRNILSLIFACIGITCLCIVCVEAQEPNGPQTGEKPGATSEIVDVPLSIATKIEDTAVEKTDWITRTRRVLEIGGEDRSSATKKAEAYKELAALKPSDDEDPRSVFAFALVAIVEKQWSSAQKHTSELLERHRDYVPARVANARLFLVLDKKLPAIAELESLARELASPSSIVTADQLTAAAAFLGLAVGYFEGPGKESVKATALKELVAVTEKIPETLKEPFTQARSAVGEEYRVLVEQGEEALKELRDGLAKDAEQMRANLEAERAKTREEAEKIKRDLESNFAQSKSKWDAAMLQSQALVRNANNLQLQQSQLVSSLSLLRPPLVDSEGNVDYNEHRRYQNDRRRLENSISDLDRQLNQLSYQYDLVGRNGMLAENQMNALRAQAQRLGMNLGMQNGSFAKMERLVRGKELSAKKIEPTLSGAKLRQARAFLTYDDFNFHKERSLLVDSLPNDASTKE